MPVVLHHFPGRSRQGPRSGNPGPVHGLLDDHFGLTNGKRTPGSASPSARSQTLAPGYPGPDCGEGAGESAASGSAAAATRSETRNHSERTPLGRQAGTTNASTAAHRGPACRASFGTGGCTTQGHAGGARTDAASGPSGATASTATCCSAGPDHSALHAAAAAAATDSDRTSSASGAGSAASGPPAGAPTTNGSGLPASPGTPGPAGGRSAASPGPDAPARTAGSHTSDANDGRSGSPIGIRQAG